MAHPSLPARWAMAAIRGYQRHLSPRKPPVCRFTPTCSEYTLQALRHHGLIKGLLLGAWRILRCHPLTPGGYDPVPGATSPSSTTPEEGKNGCSREES